MNKKFLLYICIITSLIIQPINSTYEEWVVIIIENKTSQRIVIQDSKLISGKWYANRNKDQEVNTVNDYFAIPGKSMQVNSCGKDENAKTGTEGSFNILNHKNEIISGVNFNVSFNSPKSFMLTGHNENYKVSHNGEDVSSGSRSLGTVKMSVEAVNGDSDVSSTGQPSDDKKIPTLPPTVVTETSIFKKWWFYVILGMSIIILIGSGVIFSKPISNWVKKSCNTGT